MTSTLPPDLLERCALLIEERFGLDFRNGRRGDLERSLSHALSAGAGEALQDALRQFAEESLPAEQRDALIGELTVGETFLWREPATLDVLSERALPELIGRRQRQGRRELRLWSAGCCTGEEAYTLAIMIDRLLADREKWRIEIVGSDLNARFLEKARAGVYGEWSFRGAPDWLRASYFLARPDGRFEVHPRLRESVRFERINLAEPGFAPRGAPFDLILCRNVLMYFSQERARRAIEGFGKALSEDGYIALGMIEASPKPPPGLKALRIGSALLYQKATSADAPTPATEAEPTASAPRASPRRRAAPRKRARPAPPRRAPARSASAESPEREDPLRLARQRADAGSLPEALALVGTALATDKTSIEAHLLHASILEELGREADAAEALRRAVYLEPDAPLPHFALGSLAARRRREREAARHFRNAVALLGRMDPEAVVPRSGDLSARRLLALIESIASGTAR